MNSLNSRSFLVAASVLFLLSIGYRTIFPGDDPYRCRALLETGSWIDHPDDNGVRAPFENWQPDGCMLHKYTSSDIRSCLEGRPIVLSGDSTVRHIAYGIARLLERDEALFDEEKVQPIHDHFNLTYHGVQLQFYWNPYLETFDHPKQKPLIRKLNLTSQDRIHGIPMNRQHSAAMTILGTGSWYAKSKDDWQRMATEYATALSNVSEILGGRDDFITNPMDPIDGIGNQVFFAPEAGPVYTGDNKEVDVKGTQDKLLELHEYLDENSGNMSFWPAWALEKMVASQEKTIGDPTTEGWHVLNNVAETKANVFLNLRCNARLDRLKGYPYNRTCCTDYGDKSLVQRVAVAVSIAYLTTCLLSELLGLISPRFAPEDSSFFSMKTGSFSMALLMCYYADRTQFVAKGLKLWSSKDFGTFCTISAVIGLLTMRKSKTPRAKPGLLVSPNQPFLSRDQTDEWKGWMQFIILVYHWTGSKGQGVYVVIRLLVAAYLFQTGYGHTSYFMTKKDFSFKRVASVLLRINLLPCALAYFMNTDYMNYYFSPLVSFWFLIVYATMGIGHKRLNEDVQFVLAKICVSVVLVTFIILGTPLLRWLFALLQIVFHIRWNVGDWQYRVSLDLFVVYIGMLTAIANRHTKQDLHLALRLSLAMLGVVVMLGYAIASSRFQSLSDYRNWHPYLSFVPILAFIAVRNVSITAQNHYSKAMAWLGRCSLETYTLQFHLLLAGDTEGILLVGAFHGDGSLMDRWRSLAIILPIFLWISSLTATATGNLIQLILNTELPKKDDTNMRVPAVDPSNQFSAEAHPYSDVEKTAALVDSTSGDSEGLSTDEGYPLDDLNPKQNDDGFEPLLSEVNLDDFDHQDTRPRHHGRMSSVISFVASPQARVAVLLLAMWLLNLASPELLRRPIPDGFTPHRVHN